MPDSVEMVVDDEGIEDASRNVVRAAETLGAVMQRAAAALVEEYRSHVDEQRNKDGPFAPLTPRYANRKGREGFGGKPVMRRTDAFYGSIRPSSTEDSASATTSLRYAFMQPERRPHWISDQVLEKVTDEVGDHVENAWVRGGSAR